MERDRTWWRLAGAAALLLLPVVAFYAVLVRWWTRIPLIDDYTALLRFGLEWRSLPAAAGRAVLLLRAQDSDYKLWLDHVCVAADMLLTGRLHLGVWVWVGNLLPMVLLWLLWRHTATGERRMWRRMMVFAPVPFLLLQLNYAETVNWAMAGLQNMGVITLSLLAIDLLLREKRGADVLACAAAVGALAASANGFLLLPVGAWMLLRRRAWVMAGVWCGLLVGLAFVYQAGFVLSPKRAVGPVALVRFLLSFAGGGVEAMRHQPVANASVVLGALLLGVLSVFFARRVDRGTPFAFWACVWVLLTAVLVTAGRAGLGSQGALAGRYKIYCDLLLVFAYLFAVGLARESPRARVGYGLVLATAVGMCAASDVAGCRLLGERHHELVAGAEQYRESDGALPPLRYPEEPGMGMSGTERAARDTLTQAEREGVYRLPVSPAR